MKKKVFAKVNGDLQEVAIKEEEVATIILENGLEYSGELKYVKSYDIKDEFLLETGTDDEIVLFLCPMGFGDNDPDYYRLTYMEDLSDDNTGKVIRKGSRAEKLYLGKKPFQEDIEAFAKQFELLAEMGLGEYNPHRYEFNDTLVLQFGDRPRFNGEIRKHITISTNIK